LVGTADLHSGNFLCKKLLRYDLHKEKEQIAPILMTKNDQFISYYEKTGGRVSFKIEDRPTLVVPLELHPLSPMF
jgi:hypothetical protein